MLLASVSSAFQPLHHIIVKKVFYLGALGLLLFEIANVYFIMPMPGSQEMNSIDAAYTLYRWRWVLRGLFGLLIVLGFQPAMSGRSKWLGIAALLVVAGLGYVTNFQMAADVMFYQPSVLSMKGGADNRVEPGRLVLGVAYNGEAKAYPIQFMGYHHQVRDSIGGKPIMVTYCTVCRTGRVYEPVVQGRPEQFRLVGMDHFNAMFEDKTTHSWWRQVTGEAVAGPLKGQSLPEFPSLQTTLEKWTELYPNTLVMQPDLLFQEEYDSMRTYEKGRLKGTLTRYDTASWHDKSWVVGVETGGQSKAYDWNALLKERIIYDQLGGQPIAVLLSADSSSFVVLKRTAADQRFTITNDTLESGGNRFNFIGASQNPGVPDLEKIQAHQEYWHSWRTFHPETAK